MTACAAIRLVPANKRVIDSFRSDVGRLLMVRLFRTSGLLLSMEARDRFTHLIADTLEFFGIVLIRVRVLHHLVHVLRDKADLR